MTTHATIILNGLALDINLGWPEGERLKRQTVLLDVTLSFAEPPVACETDQLESTICYDSLITKIKTCVADRKFRLIEHLGHVVYEAIKQNVKSGMRIKVCVTKKPPIANLTGGVTFCYADED